MGIRNLARIHEKEIIGKPKTFFGSVLRVCSARALFCLRESNFVRSLSFLLGIGVKSDLPAIQVTSLQAIRQVEQ